MDNLLDLLFSNPIIVIALIGFLFSFLKGNKKAKTRMPSFGGETPTQQKYDHDHDEEIEDSLSERPVYTSTFDQSPEPTRIGMARSYSFVDGDRPDKALPFDRSFQSPAEPIDMYEVGVHTEEANHLSVEDARHGIIWAEIMGPPRSKRPYGQR